MRSNSFRLKGRRIGNAAAVVAVLLIFLVAILYLRGNSPTQTPTETPTPKPTPFDYHLDISPTNSTVMQGDTVQVHVVVTYVQGSPENVTLSAVGVPVGAWKSFSQPIGVPTNSSTFDSTLQIQVSGVVPTDSYSITVNSTADNGKTHSSSYTLSIINSEITVSGTVNVPAGGVPTQIRFEQLSTNLETVKTFTAPIQSGNYAITLPNKQFYAVSVTWDNSEGSSETHQFISPFHVDANVGVTSITSPFSLG